MSNIRKMVGIFALAILVNFLAWYFSRLVHFPVFPFLAAVSAVNGILYRMFSERDGQEYMGMEKVLAVALLNGFFMAYIMPENSSLPSWQANNNGRYCGLYIIFFLAGLVPLKTLVSKKH